IPSPRQVLAATRRMIVPTTRPTTRARVPGDVESVIVVGAGLSGLAAACRLQAAGKQVTLVEANSEVGGRCRTERLRSDHGEFYADTGATVLTMPDLVDNLLLHLGVAPKRLDGHTASCARRITRCSPAAASSMSTRM